MATSRLKTVTTPVADEMVNFVSEAMPAARMRIIVDGKTPLLTHNPQSMATVAEASKGGRVPLPEVEAEAGVYRSPEGTCGLPGESFRASTLGAAGAFRLKRISARTILAHIMVLEVLIPLHRRDGTPISDYAIDARPARIQKARIMRHRPRFDEWSATFTIEFDPLLIPDPMLILKILQDAGTRIGVGDYRPSCNGFFGRFIVRSYKLF